MSKHHYKELQKQNTYTFEPSVNTLQCINNQSSKHLFCLKITVQKRIEIFKDILQLGANFFLYQKFYNHTKQNQI